MRSVVIGFNVLLWDGYLKVAVQDADEWDLIALYAGMRIDGVDGGDSIEEGKRALLRAREHGLDANRVAVVAAERSLDKAFELLPPTSTKGPLVGPESDNPLQRPPLYIETFLVCSIEWTTFSEATYSTALEQACVVLRFFLGSGRLKLTQSVLDMLPAKFASIYEPEERATEYLHYRQFFLVWESLERVVAVHRALEIDMDMSRIGSIGASREARAAWLSDYHAVLEEVNEQVTRLLTAECLVNTEGYSAGAGTHADKRRKEMMRVRRVFIPELVTRLYSPRRGKGSPKTSNVPSTSPTSQGRPLGKKRVGKTLGDYLSAVRRAVLGGLECRSAPYNPSSFPVDLLQLFYRDENHPRPLKWERCNGSWWQ
ncbi:hypothetical protein F5887DRAFT_1201965 [Amanita rubescens]|nr:hypothetical protein F5887DRAFT_1201965 [Amanita rubescens]